MFVRHVASSTENFPQAWFDLCHWEHWLLRLGDSFRRQTRKRWLMMWTSFSEHRRCLAFQTHQHIQNDKDDVIRNSRRAHRPFSHTSAWCSNAPVFAILIVGIMWTIMICDCEPWWTSRSSSRRRKSLRDYQNFEVTCWPAVKRLWGSYDTDFGSRFDIDRTTRQRGGGGGGCVKVGAIPGRCSETAILNYVL